MPTVVHAVGADNANSYCSVAEADTYFDERLNAAAWTGDDAKKRALIMATRNIDREEFTGEPVNPLNGTNSGTTQALKWPRYGACDEAGYEFESDVIPDIVKRATMELALRLLNDGTTDFLADTGLERFANVKVGPLDVTPRHAQKGGDLPAVVHDLLRPVLATQRNQVRLVRG